MGSTVARKGFPVDRHGLTLQFLSLLLVIEAHTHLECDLNHKPDGGNRNQRLPGLERAGTGGFYRKRSLAKVDRLGQVLMVSQASSSSTENSNGLVCTCNRPLLPENSLIAPCQLSRSASVPNTCTGISATTSSSDGVAIVMANSGRLSACMRSHSPRWLSSITESPSRHRLQPPSVAGSSAASG